MHLIFLDTSNTTSLHFLVNNKSITCNSKDTRQYLLLLSFRKVWVLNGSDGTSLPGWPFRVGRAHSALPLITQLDGEGPLDLVKYFLLFVTWNLAVDNNTLLTYLSSSVQIHIKLNYKNLTQLDVSLHFYYRYWFLMMNTYTYCQLTRSVDTESH